MPVPCAAAVHSSSALEVWRLWRLAHPGWHAAAIVAPCIAVPGIALALLGTPTPERHGSFWPGEVAPFVGPDADALPGALWDGEIPRYAAGGAGPTRAQAIAPGLSAAFGGGVDARGAERVVARVDAPPGSASWVPAVIRQYRYDGTYIDLPQTPPIETVPPVISRGSDVPIPCPPAWSLLSLGVIAAACGRRWG